MSLSYLQKSLFFSEKAEKDWNSIEEFIMTDQQCSKYFTEASYVEDLHVSDKVFSKIEFGEDILEILKQLHKKKYMYKTLLEREIIVRSRPFVVEFTGTPRAGKTSAIKNLEDFFKKAGFKVKVIEELTTSQYFKDSISIKRDTMSLGDYNLLIMEETYKRLLEGINSDVDILLVDRGINDRQIWNFMRTLSGDIKLDKYAETGRRFTHLSRQLVDVLFVLKVNAFTAVYRDYMTHINLETRRFNREEKIDDFNKAMMAVGCVHKRAVKHFMLIDSETYNQLEISMITANQILDIMFEEALSSVAF